MSDRRWRLDIAYDGTDFAGWAVQVGQRTVQGELETWLTRVLSLDHPARLMCAGRTDAGVHARGQVAHVDLPADRMIDDRMLARLNRALTSDVVIRRVAVAPAGFHARFSAIWRRYLYRLVDQGPPDPLWRHQLTAVRKPLDLELLNRAAERLLGLRDFGAFCKHRPGATTIRTLLEFHAVREPSGVIACTVRADAFCHSMVRSLIGGVTEVANGHRDLPWLDQVVSTPVRQSGVPLMPARGLTLEEVRYPADDQLAVRATEARTLRELP